jgi:small subunit ribosomal protein S8
MSMTDPIADMLTRIRNANMAKQQKVDIPSSNLKVSIAGVLRAEGFIKNYKVIADQKQGILRVYLKYIDEKDSVINEIKRVSKPGGRRYAKSDEIPRVKNGLGVAILSTSKGILADRAAREAGVGGEIICTIW